MNYELRIINYRFRRVSDPADMIFSRGVTPEADVLNLSVACVWY